MSLRSLSPTQVWTDFMEANDEQAENINSTWNNNQLAYVPEANRLKYKAKYFAPLSLLVKSVQSLRSI